MFAKYKLNTLIISLMIPALAFSGCSGKNAAPAKEIKNVKVSTAYNSSIEISTEYSGKLKPVDEVTVSTKLPGRVASVKADVGNEITKGQVLFTLESDDIDAQLRQAQASLDTARTNLMRTSDSSLSQQILQADSTLKQAQLQYDDAKSLFDKSKKLFDEGGISKQQLDDIETRYKNSSVQFQTAADNYNLLKNKSGPQQVEVASTQVEQAKAAVDAATVQLQNTTVYSPISGIVSARNINAGEMVSSAVPAFIIIDSKTLSLDISVSDKIVNKIYKGQSLPVKVNSIEDKTFDGVVDNISPTLDPRTQLYTIKIKIDNSNGSIRPGMLAKVSLPVEKKQNALVVPNEAIIMESGLQYVYTVRDDTVGKTLVNIGLANDKITEVTSNLKDGDYIITEGQSFLTDGEKVNPVK